jgi:hypothetical protein
MMMAALMALMACGADANSSTDYPEAQPFGWCCGGECGITGAELAADPADYPECTCTGVMDGTTGDCKERVQ